MQLRSLYGGRHLRTTLVLATTSAAAGALTGVVGFGVAGTPAARTTHVPPQPSPVASVKATPKHHAGSAPAAVWHPKVRTSHRPSASPSASASTSADSTPTPTATRTQAASTEPSPSASASTAPTTASTPSSSSAASAPAGDGQPTSPPT